MQAKGQSTGIATPTEGSVPEPAAARIQVDRLLASVHFRNSKRCQALLQHVVNAYLEGSLDRVKERTIGSEVFHRDAGYDTNQDSVVRTTAAEVRKRLAQYYLEPGHEDELRLSLPAGSYVPEFRAPAGSVPAPAAVPVVTEAPAAAPVPLPRPASRFWPLAIVAAAVVVAAAGGGWWWQSRDTAIDRFWKPLLADRAETVICIEQPLKIFRIDGPRLDELTGKLVGTGTNPPAGKDVLESSTMKLSELMPAGNQYFTVGDLMVAVRLSELLARGRKTFQVLGDRSASYHDLRGKPAILIGQFNNRWTLGLTGGLRYYLERDTARKMYEVHDRQNQGKVIASALQSVDRPEEYAIVSRVFNPATEKTVIVIMGMTQQGTLAGGDFLTTPAYMQEAFEQAPAQWYRKNIQVVIRTGMVNGTAGPPKVVTTYFW